MGVAIVVPRVGTSVHSEIPERNRRVSEPDLERATAPASGTPRRVQDNRARRTKGPTV